MRGRFDAFILGAATPAHQQKKGSGHVLSPGQAPAAPGQQPEVSSILVNQSMRKCTRCHRLKLRCCGNRPCKFCVMKNCGDSCRDYVPQVLAGTTPVNNKSLLRPISSFQRLIGSELNPKSYNPQVLDPMIRTPH
mmetsp:Transcript_25601/g.40115  ORF Transcript_25601/g.40115 Transcript_25601/m.40115 type:complete len:135 (+) Transcript_25601:84-488(+)